MSRMEGARNRVHEVLNGRRKEEEVPDRSRRDANMMIDGTRAKMTVRVEEEEEPGSRVLFRAGA